MSEDKIVEESLNVAIDWSNHPDWETKWVRLAGSHVNVPYFVTKRGPGGKYFNWLSIVKPL